MIANRNINIDQARKRLGKSVEMMKDKDIQEILNTIYFLCERVVEDISLVKRIDKKTV